MSVTQTLQTWLLAWREAFTCIGLGLRDARHAGLWWRSALWCMAVVALWLGLYGYFGRFFVELSAMLALVSVTGLLGLGVMDGVGTLANGPVTLSQMGNIAGGLGSAAKALLSIGQIALALAAFFYVMVFIVGAIGTARLPLRWLLLGRAKTVAAPVAAAFPADSRVGPVRADLVLAGLECANDLRRAVHTAPPARDAARRPRHPADCRRAA
ncbi:hypothetical protein [Janthinobacterium sp. RB2P8]|uniref:hypothetical protein n=1 Tax=Janthinobacterium sp. RB2P8 TaxID=3424191 RepID=UPI003F22D6C1